LVTNNKKLWKKAWSFKDHGRNYRKMFDKKDSCGFVWAVDDFGSNYRMTEIQAAIGRSMLLKLDSWVVRRRELADILFRGFSKFDELRVAVVPVGVYHSYYKYYVFIRPEKLKRGLNREQIIRGLNLKGIPCGTGVCPEIYREKAFAGYCPASQRAIAERFPCAFDLGRTSVMFQVHPTLSNESVRFAVKQMAKVLQGNLNLF
ncbi:MAG: DegT/DnrJ/EryC1/StrS family aminotransferase, partial [Candidatus Omnitrophica bacterium]|nr:DegT/DnrJ/EryC1/StrS family aminotransferase [Candidatus Omnitrophota bacterium]